MVNKKRSNRDEVRTNTLSVPMTKNEKDVVQDAAMREGMTMTSYCRALFNAVCDLPLAKILMLAEYAKSNN